MGLGLAVQQRASGSHASAQRATRAASTASTRVSPAHRLQRAIGNAATVRAFRSQGIIQRQAGTSQRQPNTIQRQADSLQAQPDTIQRQPETCPPSRHDQADRPLTCRGVRRERGERARFDRLGPSLRTVAPFECYVLENFSIGGTDFGTLRELEAIADFLQLNPGATLRLTGFTDCLGRPDANANLRTNRASALEDYFINVLRVDRGRVFIDFARDTEYLASNDTALGRSGNRAVAIYLELPAAPSQPGPQPDRGQQREPTQPTPNPAALTDQQCALQVGRSLGTAWLAALPNCPCTVADAERENATLAEADRWSESNWFLGCFHPGAARCFRRDSGGHAQQCCYDGANNLITEGSAAGTPDFVPSSQGGHQDIDVWPYEHLAWEDYDRFWVPNNGNRCNANVVTEARVCRNLHFMRASRPATCAPPIPTPTPTPTP